MKRQEGRKCDTMAANDIHTHTNIHTHTDTYMNIMHVYIQSHMQTVRTNGQASAYTAARHIDWKTNDDRGATPRFGPAKIVIKCHATILKRRSIWRQ